MPLLLKNGGLMVFPNGFLATGDPGNTCQCCQSCPPGPDADGNPVTVRIICDVGMYRTNGLFGAAGVTSVSGVPHGTFKVGKNRCGRYQEFYDRTPGGIGGPDYDEGGGPAPPSFEAEWWSYRITDYGDPSHPYDDVFEWVAKIDSDCPFDLYASTSSWHYHYDQGDGTILRSPGNKTVYSIGRLLPL